MHSANVHKRARGHKGYSGQAPRARHLLESAGTSGLAEGSSTIGTDVDSTMYKPSAFAPMSTACTEGKPECNGGGGKCA